MKKTTFFLLSLLTVFVFTACSDGLDNIEYNRNSDVVLTTPEATATGTSLNVKSSITGNLSSVVKRGFCYSVNVSNPTIKDKVIEADENFSATLSGLKINTPYYIRAYVYGNSRYTYSETFTSTIEITGGADDSIRKLSSAYLFWLFTAMICMLPQIGGMMVMRLDGSPKYAMFCQLIPAILNIALDYYLIFQLELETTGAALATSISGIVGALMVFLYFCKWSVNFRFTKIADAFEGIMTNTRYAVKIGFSAFFTEATTCVMMLTGNYMFMRLIGIEGVSAYSIVCYLFPVFFSFANSIIQSEQPIISFNYGNQAYGRIAATFQQAIGTAFLSGIGLSLCCLLFNRPIAEIFLGNGMEYGLAEAGIPLFAICPIFFISNMAVIGYYQSIEKAWIASLISLLRGLVVLVPSFIILPSLIGIAGLWLAIPMSEFITLTVAGGIFLFRHRVDILEKSLTR